MTITPAILVLCLLAPLAPAHDAGAPPIAEMSLLDRAGAAETVSISSLEIGPAAAEVRTVEPRGAERARPLAGVLALVPRAWGWSGGGAWPETSAASVLPSVSGWMELTDGQRFPGRPGPVVEAGERLVWVSDRFGEFAIDLDRVRRIVVRPGDAPRDASTTTDTLLLANGDRVEGFVESLRPTASPADGAFGAVVQAGATRALIPVSQIAEVRLASPAVPAAGPVVWLSDGTVARLSGATTDVSRGLFRLQADVLASAPGAGGVVIPPGDLLALAPDPGRLVPLSVVPVASHRPVGLARRPGPRSASRDDRPAPLNAADVLIPGPMVVEWVLPDGASRLIGAAVLDEADRAWGECTITAEVLPAGAADAPQRVFSGALGGAVVRLPLAFDLPRTGPGDRLRVRIDAGELGPIRDRVRLERVLLIRDAGR